MRLLVATFFVLAIGLAVRAQVNESVFEFDPELRVNFELSEKVRLELASGCERTERLSRVKCKVSAGASYRIKPFVKQTRDDPNDDKRHTLVVASYYEYSHSTEDLSETSEHRIIVDATPRYLFPSRLLLSDRSRSEFRWVNGDYRFRYRNRLKFERPVAFGKLKLTPHGSVEGYWDQHYDRWSKFKWIAGTEIPIGKRASIDAYYEYQHCVVCESSHIHVFGLSLELFFNLKRK